MKRVTNIWIGAVWLLIAQSHLAAAQSVDDDRMKRDIEVGENVLATLIKQELGQDGAIFGLDVNGSYQPGYGVTFRLPPDHTLPFVISIGGDRMNGASVISNGMSYRYSISTSDDSSSDPKIADGDAYRLAEKSKTTADSLEGQYSAQMIKAATNFILDYGDLLSQLGGQEKIVVTNQSDRPRFFNPGRRTRISVEGTRSDIAALKEGKITRQQAVKKLRIVNTESVESRDADLEILSSIFTRLYHPDVSKTYFIDGNVYYERLKDYGAVYYMQMISSIERNLNRFFMPTQGLDNLNQEARDKKVAELYPVFEKEIKENILEYGRTVKTLKDDELLIFNISLTKCTGCSIPGTLELSIPASALKDFGSGKIDKSSALNRFNVKKGANQ